MKWGPTNLVGLARVAFDALKGECCNTHYYAYLDKEDIAANIVEQRHKDPHVRINIVGHSRGAAVANEIALKHLSAINIKVNLLVLLDPVKASTNDKFILPTDKDTNNVNTSICIFAKPTTRDPTDYVAIVGGQYGDILRHYCDYFCEADTNHGEVMKMLKSNLGDRDQSAWDLLISESKTA